VESAHSADRHSMSPPAGSACRDARTRHESGHK